ncbi:MAG: hypothetical protein V1701_09485 [Planctomycetota bacterium]
MNDELITKALLTEFSEMRAEIRTMKTGCTTTLNISIAFIAAVISLSSFSQDFRLLFLIPTTIFFGGMIQMSSGTSISNVGIYCLLISNKIKKRLGKDAVGFEWEYGPIWRASGNPFGIVLWGFYLAAVPFAAAFFIISWFAFQWWSPSLLIHGFEFIIVVIYGMRCLRYNSQKARIELLKKAEQTAEGDS